MLTWATVAAAVVSALWLAAVEAEQDPVLHLTAPSSMGLLPAWPGEPTRAGPAPRRHGDAAAPRPQP